MIKEYTRVCARINMDAIAYNIEQMKERISKEALIMAVIKADGYGHGAVPIAKMLQDKPYLWGFAVATLDEAVVLRLAGITNPILVLGCIFPDQYMAMLKEDITMTVYTEEMAAAISKLAEEQQKTAKIHIKLDTGMGRLGFPINESSAQTIQRISGLPHICLDGIFTHFATADEINKAFTMEQMNQYLWMVNRLKELAVNIPYRHCSNSAGIIDVKEANFDIVRAGISTYGLYPSEDVRKENLPLKPALELTSHIAFVKEVKAGTPISYGATFITPERMIIATIPVGYADGYPRSLSNKGYVLIHGMRAYIVGRVCMDQFMVDVTAIAGVKSGDKVTLVGMGGEEYLAVEVLSDLSGRFNYEFVCDLSKRIPREYMYNGKVKEQIYYFG